MVLIACRFLNHQLHLNPSVAPKKEGQCQETSSRFQFFLNESWVLCGDEIPHNFLSLIWSSSSPPSTSASSYFFSRHIHYNNARIKWFVFWHYSRIFVHWIRVWSKRLPVSAALVLFAKGVSDILCLLAPSGWYVWQLAWLWRDRVAHPIGLKTLTWAFRQTRSKLVTRKGSWEGSCFNICHITHCESTGDWKYETSIIHPTGFKVSPECVAPLCPNI